MASNSKPPPSPSESEPKLNDRTLRIRTLNDTLRRHGTGGRIVVTAGVVALPAELQAALLARLRSYDEFSADDDPYGEHDFGKIDEGGERFFWKIDYYDTRLSRHSDDPADADQTMRVLTVMLADEY